MIPELGHQPGLVVMTNSLNVARALSELEHEPVLLMTGGTWDPHSDSFQGQVAEQDIVDWCRENMAVYKVPRIVQFVDALPKSGSGKVMWRSLQEAEARP